MSHSNSQEHMIYRSLAGQIQLGFYGDEERFLSVQEVADRYQVSYCPAQRALKSLERDGLIQLRRGKSTVVLKKPYEDYLKNDIFQRRLHALDDLNQALKLLSTPICFQGVCQMDSIHGAAQLARKIKSPVKRVYRLFDLSLRALGSRTVLNLYYDVGAFLFSAYQDMLYSMGSREETDLWLQQLSEAVLQSIQDCCEHRYGDGKRRLENMSSVFYENIDQHCQALQVTGYDNGQENFLWEPHKGRIRYCDVIAIDILRKINMGAYPVGTLMPNSAVLADTYHVSEITIRRTIGLLNQLGVTKTRNGVGTGVVCAGDTSIPYKIKDLMSHDNFKTFLEALQLLAITCENVIQHSFPYFSRQSLHEMTCSLAIEESAFASMAMIGTCLQAIVHCSPLASIREIYGKMTLLLLNGSVFQYHEPGKGAVPGWPEISLALAESLTKEDASRFAAAFRTLIENSFAMMKKRLLEIGVVGVDGVSAPMDLSYQP